MLEFIYHEWYVSITQLMKKIAIINLLNQE